MTILRDGDNVFVLGPCGGHGFNVKLISRVLLEDMHEVYGDPVGGVFLSIWSGGAAPLTMQVTRDETRQMFQDTPWMLILKEHK